MDSLKLLSQAQAAGLTVRAEGDKLVIRGPRSAEVLAKELLENKAELMALLSSSVDPRAAWPPPDAEELIAKWKGLGCPKIPVAPGLSFSDLYRWFYPAILGERPAEHLAGIRGFLLEGLYPCEVPRADPLLEEWRRTSLPLWKEKLVEAEVAHDAGAIDRARWMLELLEDNESSAS